MGHWSVLKNLFNKMKQRPELCLIIFCFIVFGIFRLLSGVKGNDNSRPAKPPKPIFSDVDFIKEAYSGSLMERDIFLDQSEVSFVFFYAPWCRSSMLAAKQFAQTAQIMHKQISFIAVNCWWSKSDCRRSMKLVGYPQLLLYHPSSFHPILYKGPHLSMYYEEFLNKALNPFVYLGTSEVIESFLKKGQVSIIGYFEFSKSSFIFRKYIETALIALEQYPLITFNFGVILSKKLSYQLGLKINHLNLYDRTISVDQPFSHFEMRKNTTMMAVIDWAKNRTMALKKIVSCNVKSNALHRVLKEGPTLMTFYVDLNQVELLDDLAVRYHKHFDQTRQCCQSVNSSRYSVCIKDNNALDCPTFCLLFNSMFDRFLREQKPTFLPATGGCGHYLPIYDNYHSRLEVCLAPPSTVTPLKGHENASHTGIDGLLHKTNLSLRFLALDHTLIPGIADVLGFSALAQKPPFSVILDMQSEQKYFMEMSFSTPNLELFIMNYTNGILTPSYINKKKFEVEENNNLSENVISLPAVHTHQFEVKVLNSAQDVLVYYHTDWCGGCFACSHSLLNLRMIFPNLEKLGIYQVQERTNDHLPHSFKALSFPTIILYPGNRTSDSVVFSSSSCTLTNIVDFLLRYSSPPTKAELILSMCDVFSNDPLFQIPTDICKQKSVVESLTR